ncbi:HEAT repeat domain-containing protein [Planctomicrobium sp. SH661]|uniref:HEAT repeat domain-containing protein n=1 Tax=Planctomicrobium sp. SH661 TaxID=3448124 RepID=UPI003F5B524F
MQWFSCPVRVLILSAFLHIGGTALAQSPAAPMMKLLQSGRVPEQRLPAIVKLVCERGDADDLSYLLAEVLKENHWPESLRSDVLTGLIVASVERKVIPSGDLSGLSSLIESTQPELKLKGVELAGDWKVASTTPLLTELAGSSEADVEVRRAALNSLVKLAPEQAGDLLKALASEKETFALRVLAVSVLAKLNVEEAAKLAAELLQKAQPTDQFNPLLPAFLDLNQGSKILAAQLQLAPPEKDVARLLLRQMYALGRTDLELNQVLSNHAGMNQVAAPPTPEEVQALVKQAVEQGDPARGELVFRRKDLSCVNCHAVSKAGGQIGPDLSAIGSSSPVEYLVTSVLDPDQAIKEAFISKTILTSDGKILQGIVADRTKDALVLKDATGKKISIPLEDIEDEVEGKSLMPKGLVNFMTQAELFDLISFLSHLGKPGEYGIRSTQRMQRYRVLNHAPESVLDHVPTLPVFEDAVLQAQTWEPAYAMVNGNLPLEELAAQVHSRVLYLRGDINCTESGKVEIQLNNAEGVTLWIDDTELGSEQSTLVDLTPGEHALVVRVDLSKRSVPTLKIEVNKPQDSAAEYTVVDGQ